MTQLDAKTRARLPDSAFAYIDARGRRLLPINDEGHVRNALSRFNQTTFENEAARDRARTRLLRAAKKYGIVPIGFMTGQLRSQSLQAAAGKAVIELGGLGTSEQMESRLRIVLGDPTLAVLQWSDSAGSYLDGNGQVVVVPTENDRRTLTVLEQRGRPTTALLHDRMVLTDPDLARTVIAAAKLAVENQWMHAEVTAGTREVRTLPTGFVTFLFTDIEDSTALVRQLGERYEGLLADTRRLLRVAIQGSGGRVVETRADEMFAVFERASAALEAALAIQKKVGTWAWPTGVRVRIRIGLHAGRPTLTDTGYLGLPVHTAARICFASHGGQILLSSSVREAVAGLEPAGVGFGDLGLHRLHGLPAAERLFQVESADLLSEFPPPRTLASTPRRRKPSVQKAMPSTRPRSTA